MATPLFSVGGLASGLDTTSIISQLMQLERQPIVRFQSQQADLRKIDSAWGTVTTKLSSFRTALDALAKPGSVAAMFTATSSRAEAIGVTVGGQGTAVPGSTSLTVQRLASTHQVQVGGSFASGQALVGAGTFRLLAADGTTEMANVTTTASTTLDQLAAQVNAAGTGVTAQVLKVADGDSRLVITSRETGAAKAFSVASAPPALAGATTLTQAVNARVSVGGLTVERSSNVINDLVAGTTLTLKQVSATPVTVDVAQDVDGAIGKVKALVDALNGALSTLKDLTKYDPASKTAGALQGDPAARQILSDLRASFGSQLSEGSVAGLGISFDRYGAAKLDEAVLRKALLSDAGAVQRTLSDRSVGAVGVRIASAPAGLPTGTYDVAVTAQATTAAHTGTVYKAATSDRIVSLTTGGRQIDVVVAANSTLTQAVAAINTTLSAAGVTSLAASEVTLATGERAIHLQGSSAGAAASFTVTASPGRFGLLVGTYSGTDAAGTINGVTATASGSILTAPNGLAVDVAGATSGRVTVASGLTGVVDATLDRFEGAEGVVRRARDTLSGAIRRLDTRIADFEVRVAQREQTLRMKFAALETALARSSSQGAWLAGQFGGQG